MATKKDAPKDAPDAFERKPTTARARRRNPVTEVDVVFGGQLKQARNSTGLSLRDTAERMANPDGTPHYLVSATLERIAEEGPSKDLNAQLGKAPQRLETAEQAITLSGALAYCAAIGIDIATPLQGAGYSRPLLSTEASIMGDRRLDEAGRVVMLELLRSLLAARR